MSFIHSLITPELCYQGHLVQEVVQLFGEGETAMKPADQVQSPKFMAEVMESHCRLPQVLPGKQKSLVGRVRPSQGDTA